MKDAILLEPANRWEGEANAKHDTAAQEDSPAGYRNDGKDIGRRETLRECADALRMLISIVGDHKN